MMDHEHVGVIGICIVTFAYVLAAIILFLMALAARADGLSKQEFGTLTVFVENVMPRGGIVRVGLYDSSRYQADNLRPIASADVPAKAGETVVTLTAIPPGIYAIETYQDINANGAMDMSWIGLPLEPFGFSRDAQPHLSKPQFSRVQFAIVAGPNSQTLHLQNSISRNFGD